MSHILASVRKSAINRKHSDWASGYLDTSGKINERLIKFNKKMTANSGGWTCISVVSNTDETIVLSKRFEKITFSIQCFRKILIIKFCLWLTRD